MRSIKIRVLVTGAAALAIGICAETSISDKNATHDPVSVAVDKGMKWLVSVQGKDGGWGQDGGTSAAAPPWCAIVAIANSIRAEMGKDAIGATFLNVVYSNPSAFHDITRGSNGSCGAECQAGPGWDFVTGLGSPMAPLVVDALIAAP